MSLIHPLKLRILITIIHNLVAYRVKMKFFANTPLLIIAVLLSGCASGGGITGLSSGEATSTNLQTFDASQYDTQNASKIFAPAITEDTFSPGDTVTVTVNGLKEFSGIYNVDNTGKIFLGHFGHVQAAGLTIPQLQSELHQGYSSCCLVNPNVSIEREGQAFGKIVVDGAVNGSGVFEIDEVINLSQAVALGGGLDEIADPASIMISRVIDGERKVSQVNLQDIRLAGANDPLVYPNDVIFVQGSKGRLLYQDFVKTIPIISAIIIGATR